MACGDDTCKLGFSDFFQNFSAPDTCGDTSCDQVPAADKFCRFRWRKPDHLLKQKIKLPHFSVTADAIQPVKFQFQTEKGFFEKPFHLGFAHLTHIGKAHVISHGMADDLTVTFFKSETVEDEFCKCSSFFFMAEKPYAP